MKRKSYPTDLTDAEWKIIQPLIERREGPGRPVKVDRRDVLNAMSYVVRSGCAWRLLPSDFPPWQTVYSAFRRWTQSGLLEKILNRFREMWRERQGRHAEPSAAIIDSQSVKTTEKGGSKGSTRERK
jgi:putative transposase